MKPLKTAVGDCLVTDVSQYLEQQYLPHSRCSINICLGQAGRNSKGGESVVSLPDDKNVKTPQLRSLCAEPSASVDSGQK